MVVFGFELGASNCVRFHDALTCLAKFSDTVSFEARYGQLILSALNSSKSAYASIALASPGFFTAYDFEPNLTRRDERFTCRFSNKALSSVFRGRVAESRNGEGIVERCEASIQEDAVDAECRLAVKLSCRQGVTKTYQLTYESTEIMQALFNKASASSRWKIEARTLKQSAEYFGPKTEQLDICYDQEQVTLTSYTEKVMHGKEVLKQPMQTAITIDTADFEEFSAPELVHIGISVKDFRNIVTHAESLKCSVTAIYSYPTKPLQFSYGSEGMSCEFTLMTIGDFGDSATPAMSRAGTREPQRQPAPQTSASGVLGSNASNSRSSRSARPLGSRPDTGSQHRVEEDQASEGLFVPGDEDEKQWDPAEPQDEDGEMLDWDASADHDTFRSTFRNDASMHKQVQNATAMGVDSDMGVLPTQRASQFRGIFDD